MSTATRKAARPATASRSSQPGALTPRRYCSQPVQPIRQFDIGVAAGRARAIIAASTKWVNGTQLTY